jgi:GDSL-like Lipase/Acylhydrolase family/SsfX3, N-terminal domain
MSKGDVMWRCIACSATLHHHCLNPRQKLLYPFAIQPESTNKEFFMPLTLSPTDARLTWQGAVSLETTDEYAMPWRIPEKDRVLFPFEDGLQIKTMCSAGIRLSFHTDATSIAGVLVPSEASKHIDLYMDGDLVDRADIADKDAFSFTDLAPEMKLIELWLPHTGPFKLKSLDLSDGATVEPYNDTRPKWVTYGSSITHCGAAESPSFTWPAVAARSANVNLTCLGYGGQCHLDSMIARMIRDLPADLISIKCGINIYGHGSLNARSFQPAIIGSVQTIRDKHPTTPIALISPIYGCNRETEENAVGFTLQMMRDHVKEATRRLREHGDKNVHYFDGLDLFDASLAHLLPDNLHPDAEGYKIMGKNFYEKIMPTLLGKHQ